MANVEKTSIALTPEMAGLVRRARDGGDQPIQKGDLETLFDKGVERKKQRRSTGDSQVSKKSAPNPSSRRPASIEM